MKKAATEQTGNRLMMNNKQLIHNAGKTRFLRAIRSPCRRGIKKKEEGRYPWVCWQK